ncbi:MAG: hypothetical protein ACI4WS_13430 [Oscillospiraceae bacterium]
MSIECAAIAGIILIMALIFWRKHRIQWVWATLPLMLVPLAYCVMYAVIQDMLGVEVSDLVGVIVLIAAVGISCVWLGLVSNGFKDKKTRVTYISVANTFNVALAAILGGNIISL